MATVKRGKSRVRGSAKPAPGRHGREREADVAPDAQSAEGNNTAAVVAPVFEIEDAAPGRAPEGVVDDWADTDTAAGMADEPTAGRRRR
ncbi:MAG: hypothetical protein IPO58_09160 [Betaproteobacteria bacterium]|nr:hypothetical protein [Betaproteobacteria bacterium]MBK9606557.1 hypothetical protein [Betaproteobacteria bacterium]